MSEKSWDLAASYAKHLSTKWKLSIEQTAFLEIALHLFSLGVVAVPLCMEKLKAFLPLLEGYDIQNALSLLETSSKSLSTLPPSWICDHKEKESPFVINCIEDVPYLYPQKLFTFEWEIAQKCTDLFKVAETNTSLPSVETSLFDGLKEEQKRALIAALSFPFTLITGGPGTGKSFIAARIIQAHKQSQKAKNAFCHVLVAAPTGKAVIELKKKLSSGKNDLLSEENAEPLEFMTLHRLLQMTPSSASRLKKPFLDASLIVIDECSMIDMEMFSYLLSKLHPKTTLVLIGDPEQLPPVGSGDVFASLCKVAKEIQHKGFVTLGESIRFENANLGLIANLCQKQDPSLIDALRLQKNLTPLCDERGSKRFAILDKLYQDWRKKTSLFEAKSPVDALLSLQSAIVLCSLKEGKWGVKQIGFFFLEKALLQKCRYIPILFTRNDERLQFQNGLLAILELDDDCAFSRRSSFLPKGTIYYSAGETILSLESEKIRSFELAFSISVHKSQGSEFKHISFVLAPGSEQFGKSLLYTAITRAKQSLSFFSSEETLLKTLLFPSGNLSRLRDRLRLKLVCNEEVPVYETSSPSADPDPALPANALF